ncbi:MAG: SagB/ThcOx family dehydrogenase [Candidatus Krumholzibacteria bacterium]|nr:SagB/ThcOx family dehydrogenase [Candidatus Krumholzibacteria bacterium]
MIGTRKANLFLRFSVLVACAIAFQCGVAVLRPLCDCEAACTSASEPLLATEEGDSVSFWNGSADTIQLPPVPRAGEVSIEEAIWCRRSIRSFTDEAPTPDIVSRLLWAAQGVTSEEGFRSAPSAGATYPLEVFLAAPAYLARYEPEGHRLIITMRKDVRKALAKAALGQHWFDNAPLIFILAADVSRTSVRYGKRADLYVHIEVGCASENLMLQAAAMGWGSVPIGAFLEEDVSRVLELPKEWTPYLIVPVGVEAE